MTEVSKDLVVAANVQKKQVLLVMFYLSMLAIISWISGFTVSLAVTCFSPTVCILLHSFASSNEKLRDVGLSTCRI